MLFRCHERGFACPIHRDGHRGSGSRDAVIRERVDQHDIGALGCSLLARIDITHVNDQTFIRGEGEQRQSGLNQLQLDMAPGGLRAQVCRQFGALAA